MDRDIRILNRILWILDRGAQIKPSQDGIWPTKKLKLWPTKSFLVGYLMVLFNFYVGLWTGQGN